MSVIIRLQNLPWSANALDIRNFFRGLSIPEGGVHIVGGELGDAFIAFSTDEDARQAMMLDGGKIKEIQVKLLLSSRSEMHKVIEAARQTVPLLSLAPTPPVAPIAPVAPTPAPAPAPAPAVLPPVITPFSAALGQPTSSFGIPGIGNPQEIPQPAVIELPPSHASPTDNLPLDDDREEDKIDKRKEKDRRRSRSRSRSRDRDRKERKRDRRDRSRSRERRRRDRSRSRDRRDRKRDRKDRSRSRERSPRRSRDRRKSPSRSQEKESPARDAPPMNPLGNFGNPGNLPPQLHQMLQTNTAQHAPALLESPRFNDPTVVDTLAKMQQLAKKRNPNAFQVDHNGGKPGAGRGGGGGPRGGGFSRERRSRFDEPAPRDCCVAIRNAPNHTSYGDVRRFFPFLIDKHGIKMINDNMGRRTGNIFVRFIESRSRQLALQRKNNELKGAQVTVEELDDEAYEAALDSFLPYREDNAEEAPPPRAARPYAVLKLADLPHYVKEHDIIKTFNDFSLLSITLMDCRLTRSKVALVQFAKPDEAKAAFERRERLAFGRRQSTVTALDDDDFEKEKALLNSKSEPPRPQEEAPREPAPPRDPRQRRQFDNGGSPAAPNAPPQPVPPFFGQPFVQNPGGFPPAQGQGFPPTQGQGFPPVQGQGFPPGPGQFPGPQFGGFPGPGPANVDPRTAANSWPGRSPFPQPEPPEEEPLDCVLMKGLPRDATDRTIVSFLSDTGAVPARIHLMLDAAGQPSGDCFCEFRSTQEARLAAGKHGRDLDGCRVTVDIVPHSVVDEALEGPKANNGMDGMQEAMPPGPPQHFFDSMPRGGFNGRGGGTFRGRGGGGFDRGGFNNNRGGFDSGRGFRGRGGFDRGSRGGFEGRGRGGRGMNRGGGGGGPPSFENSGRGGGPDDDAGLEDFGAPGCVVSMENVPFRATIDEIMQFFSEFELTQDDVIRRYNERGQPTGDARVAFRTPFDAQRAVKTRHMDTIHDRRINLNIL